MTMGDETPITSLVLPVLLRPILSQVNKINITFYFGNNDKSNENYLCNCTMKLVIDL